MRNHVNRVGSGKLHIENSENHPEECLLPDESVIMFDVREAQTADTEAGTLRDVHLKYAGRRSVCLPGRIGARVRNQMFR